MEKRDIVLFLGAGFSRFAGLPTMAEFGDESERELSNLKKENKPATKILIPAGEIFEKFQKLCENAKGFVNIDTKNMEDIYCIAESMAECDIKEIREIKNDKGENLKLEELIEKIKLWLWKIYQKFPPFDDDKNPPPPKSPPYKKFFKSIKENNLSHRMTVITTNYDIVFEYFAWEAGIPCKYPFESNEYEPLILRDGKDKEGSQNYISDDESAPLLCKLHGSINYFSNDKEKDKENIYITNKIFEEGQGWGISKVPIREPKTKGKPAILVLDAICHISDKPNPQLVPAIIPPTYSKLKGYAWLQNIWKTAFQAIQTAETLIFIGYSFPESDGFMKALFQGSFAHHKEKEKPCIYVFDPKAGKDCDTGKRYIERFRPLIERLKLFPLRFEEAVDTELKNILEKI